MRFQDHISPRTEGSRAQLIWRCALHEHGSRPQTNKIKDPEQLIVGVFLVNINVNINILEAHPYEGRYHRIPYRHGPVWKM